MADVSLVVVRLFPVSGINADVVETNFAFEAAPSTFFADMVPLLKSFFNDPADTGFSISDYISRSVSRVTNKCQMLCYHLVDLTGATDLGPPAFVESWTLDETGFGGAGLPLPSEVACVMSSHAQIAGVPETAINPTPPPARIRPASRHRSRNYIGPLLNQASTQDADSKECVTSTDFIETVRQAGQALMAAPVSTWSVWSRADATLRLVDGGYVDNEFDTQRRRGFKATARVSW